MTTVLEGWSALSHEGEEGERKLRKSTTVVVAAVEED